MVRQSGQHHRRCSLTPNFNVGEGGSRHANALGESGLSQAHCHASPLDSLSQQTLEMLGYASGQEAFGGKGRNGHNGTFIHKADFTILLQSNQNLYFKMCLSFTL